MTDVRLKNRTGLPTRELIELTDFVLRLLQYDKRLHIKVLNARVERGQECDRRIKIWLPRNGWPRSGNTGTYKNFPHYLMRTWQEGYVVLLAHEVTHAFGTRETRKGEWLCEANACAVLLTYRSL